MSLFSKNPNETNYVGGSKHILDVLKNRGNANLLLWKQPEEDFNINSVLIVMPGEEAVFIKNGEIVNVFSNGRYELRTENYPFLSRIRNSLSGGISSFNCVVYFVRKAHSLEILWGTNSPIQLRDPIQHIATTVQARGSYKLQIENCGVFLAKMVGNVNVITQDSINDYFNNQFQANIKSVLTQALKNSNQEVLGVCSELERFSEIITPTLQEIFDNYGVRLINFSISAMDIPQDDPNRMRLEEAYAKRREFEIMGEQYRTIRGLDILENMSKNPGSGGIASMGAGLGMGMAAGGAMGSLAQAVFQQPLQQSQPATNSSVTSTTSVDPMEKLSKLKQMFDAGLIEQEEYDSVKKEILSKMI